MREAGCLGSSDVWRLSCISKDQHLLLNAVVVLNYLEYGSDSFCSVFVVSHHFRALEVLQVI